MRAIVVGLALAFAVGVASPAAGQGAEPQGAEAAVAADPAVSEALTFASSRGRLLYALDRAAWVATDALLAKVRNPEIGGWVVEPALAADRPMRVLFLDPARTEAAYIVEIGPNAAKDVIEAKTAEERTLSPANARMASALGLLRTSKEKSCGGSLNTVIVPPASAEAAVEAYLLTPQPTLTAAFIGGHVRYRIEPGASALPEPVRSAKSCLSLDKSRLGGKGAPVAAVVSHISGPTPTEFHVFTSITLGLPIYVQIPGGALWEVAGPEIRRIEEGGVATKP